eukprot:764728-Hanusia_phi.AAC.1
MLGVNGCESAANGGLRPSVKVCSVRGTSVERSPRTQHRLSSCCLARKVGQGVEALEIHAAARRLQLTIPDGREEVLQQDPRSCCKGCVRCVCLCARGFCAC